MGKLKKKSKSTNVLEIDQNDQHYKRYFNSIYEDEFNLNKQNIKPLPSKKNSLNFQHHNSFKEDESNHLLNWRRLQLSRTKLKQTAKTSALFAGFAMVVLVEIQLNNDPENPIPPNLLIVFGICTILLVSIHILALMIATCILPSVESIALLENFECANDSPHERLRFFIELAWTFSSVIGVFLFLAEVIILVWVKFWELGHPLGEPGKQAALASTIVFIPFIFVFFFFAIYFYRDFAKNKYEKSTKQIEELESIIVGLQRNDNHLNEMFYSNKSFTNKAKKIYKRQQQYKLNTSQDRSNLYLKNLCRYNNRNQELDINQDLNNSDNQKNEYLLNDTLKQSISVDQIDKDDQHFKNNKDEFKFDDLYRSKICRKNLESKIIVNNDNKECVRFSLDNVNFNTFNNIYNNNNNNIQYFNRTISKNQIESFDTTKSNPIKTIRQQSNSSSNKSINSNEKSSENNSMIAINDQQLSNDSNKISHLKKQDNKNQDKEIKIDNLSSSIV